MCPIRYIHNFSTDLWWIHVTELPKFFRVASLAHKAVICFPKCHWNSPEGYGYKWTSTVSNTMKYQLWASFLACTLYQWQTEYLQFFLTLPHIRRHGGLAQSLLQEVGKWLPLGYPINPSNCVGWQLTLLRNIFVVFTHDWEKKWDFSCITLSLIAGNQWCLITYVELWP